MRAGGVGCAAVRRCLVFGRGVGPCPRALKHALYGDDAITVVKVGGGLLGHDGSLDAVLSALTEMARDERLVIVPGGGPFADAVRAQDAVSTLSDDAAHWMAILAMDQVRAPDCVAHARCGARLGRWRTFGGI